MFVCFYQIFSITFVLPSSLKPDVILIGDQDKRLKRPSERQKEIIKIIEEFGEVKASEMKEKLSEQISDRTLRFDLGVLKKLV